MAQPIGRGAQPYYSGIEVVPAERSIQSSPQYFDGSQYPIHVGTDQPQPTYYNPSPQQAQYPFNSQTHFTPNATNSAYEPVKESLPASKHESYIPPTQDKAPAWQGTEPVLEQPRRRSRRWLWIGIGAIVVIAAIVGGVTGGVLSNRSKRESQVAEGTSSGDLSGSSTSSSLSSSSTPTSAITSSVSSAPTSTTMSTAATMSGTATSMSSYQFPTAVSWGYPHLEVFALQDNVYPHWKYKDTASASAWSPATDSLTSIGGETVPFQLGIAASARSATDVDIFVTGTDRALWHKYHSASMVWGPSATDWEFRDGGLISPPTVVSWAADRLDIWVIGDDYRIYQQWWDEDGWHDWVGFDPSYTWTKDAPTVISWGDNRYDIFLVNDTDSALYHKYWDGSAWRPSGWENLGGYCMSRPVAVSWMEGHIEVFVRGGDAGLWRTSFSQYSSDLTWSEWTSISGDSKVKAEPEAVSWGVDNIEVFAWGEDDTLLHKRYDTTADTWTPSVGFDVIGEGLSGPPKAVSDRSGGVHVFAYLADGSLGHKSWDQDAAAWVPEQGFESLGSI